TQIIRVNKVFTPRIRMRSEALCCIQGVDGIQNCIAVMQLKIRIAKFFNDRFINTYRLISFWLKKHDSTTTNMRFNVPIMWRHRRDNCLIIAAAALEPK
ncbi:MAG: hypothetical protein ACI4NJ_04295, partial [Cellvibrio sp.]